MSEKQMRAPRILVAHNVARHGKGGMARMMESIHDQLEARGWQIDYFTSESVPQGASARRRRHGFGWYVRQFARHAYRNGRPYDVINIHEPSGLALVYGKAAMGNPAIVAMSHGLELRHWELRMRVTPPGPARPGWKERLAYPLTTLWQAGITLRRADHVFCLNEQDKQYVHAQLGRKREEISVVYPGVSEEFQHLAAGRSYVHGKRLLMNGSWIERKGSKVFVEAFSELASADSQYMLTILGAGMDQQRVREHFPEALHARVFAPPMMDHAGCAQALIDHDIFVLPSYFEGTPLAMLEAMATAMPLVTTRTCGMQDVVRHGENGLLVEPGDANGLSSAIHRLATDAVLRQQLGKAAAAAAPLYTWQRTADVAERAYRRICRDDA